MSSRRVNHWFNVLLRNLLYFATVPSIVASPIDTGLADGLAHNLTLPSDSSTSINPTPNLTTPHFPNIHCLPSSNYPSFITPSFRPGDCVKAIRDFNDRTAFPPGTETFEFFSQGAVPQFLEPKQRSPQKWWQGTCVLAVVLLSDFAEGDLPGGTWKDRKNDLENYGMMVGQAMDVDRACLDLREVPPSGVDGVDLARRGQGNVNFVQDVGFAVVGHFEAMGVFLWDTNSFVNSRIRTVEELAAANQTSGFVDELPQTS
ncbi:MAG: hypothetical protein OHK93_001699 [Ramalina farinacea]|uniref:Ecp2 effector protein domain-containing protein n=1 Tax=Ramalina farinacea TaxID=258253 RepID=A0AA43QQ16_9LECA|nr:hypothetical protein [Ramalina farinacea]